MNRQIHIPAAAQRFKDTSLRCVALKDDIMTNITMGSVYFHWRGSFQFFS